MPLAIIICSLDGLSRVQANIGRFDTDLMVRGLTLSMRESFRDYDFLGRIGPGEFLLILPGVSPFAVRAKATKLLQIASGAVRMPSRCSRRRRCSLRTAQTPINSCPRRTAGFSSSGASVIRLRPDRLRHKQVGCNKPR